MRLASLALVTMLATGTYLQFAHTDAHAAVAAKPAAVAAKIGEKAPAFTGTDVNGKTISLSDYAGKIVVLEWTNPGCPFVKKHYILKNVQKLQKEYTDKGVIWLSINSSAQGKEGHLTADEGKNFVKDAEAAPTAYILDSKGEIGHLYGAKTTPHLFVIAKDGTLAYQGAIDDHNNADIGDTEGAKSYVKEAVDALLVGKKVETTTTAPYGCSVKY